MSGPDKILAEFARRNDSEIIVEVILAWERPLSISGLEILAGAAVGRSRQPVRKGPIYSIPDSNGKKVQFVEASQLNDILSNICKVWNAETQSIAIIERFLWLIVAMSNAHAFRDGNGRVARALGNAYLIKNGVLPHGPLPLGPLAYATGGNFELAVRRAEILGDWRPISHVMITLIEIYSRLYPTYFDYCSGQKI